MRFADEANRIMVLPASERLPEVNRVINDRIARSPLPTALEHNAQFVTAIRKLCQAARVPEPWA